MLLAAVFAVTVTAQNSGETALELVGGENSWALETSGETAYWRYTPDENTLLTVSVSAGYFSVYTYLNEGDTYSTSLSGARRADNSSVFYLEQGRTYYVSASGSNTGTLTAGMETGENVGKGQSADNPMPVVLGEDAFMGTSISTGGNQTTYASYTAAEDGVLQFTFTTYVQVSVNGGTATAAEYSGGNYVYRCSVVSGQDYSFAFTHYGPFIFTAEMVDIDEGSLDMPFTLVEGENDLPANYGEYWYTFTPSKTGYGIISSDESLPMGQVKVYNSSYAIQYGQVYAASETGSYDVRFEIPYTGNTYYVCVTRGETADQTSKFNFAVDDYRQGEKEDNPIVLEALPATVTTENAGGTYYYAVDVQAGEHKFLNVEAASEITSTATSVAVYVQGNSYSATSGNKAVRAEVDGGTSGQRYIIRWTSSETQPITFTASLEDINPGDLMSEPIGAVLGTNTIDADGTRYYKYAATKNGKLVLTAETVEMAVSFFIYNYGYPTQVTASQNGNEYSLSATAGTEYYIRIDNAKAGDTFTLAEAAFEQGETRDNPIIVEDGTFTFGAATYGDYWLQYTVGKDGILVIDCDVPYSYTEQVLYGKKDDQYLSGMTTTIQDGEDYTTVYKVETSAVAGDVYLVNLKMATPHTGCKVTFTVRDAVVDETIDNPITLVPGQAVEIPTPSRTKPVWCKATLSGGDVKVEANYSVTGMFFEGEENAKNNNGEYIYFQNYDPYTYEPLEFYTWTSSIVNAGDYYFKFEQGSAGTTLTLSGTSTSIENVAAEGSAISLDGNTLNVNVGNADVRVYTISGATVVSEKVSGGASFSLDKGIYIVKINNTVKKIIVR